MRAVFLVFARPSRSCLAAFVQVQMPSSDGVEVKVERMGSSDHELDFDRLALDRIGLTPMARSNREWMVGSS